MFWYKKRWCNNK